MQARVLWIPVRVWILTEHRRDEVVDRQVFALPPEETLRLLSLPLRAVAVDLVVLFDPTRVLEAIDARGSS